MYFTKDANGNMILVRAPVSGTTYLDKDGNEVTYKEAPAVHSSSSISELTGLVTELAQEVSKAKQINLDIKARRDELEAQVAAGQEAQARGFIMPTMDAAGATVDELKDLFAPYDVAKQGMNLMDKRFFPNYQIQSDAKREEMAKWFILFLKGTLGKDPAALSQLQHNPRWVPKEWVGKTAISSTTFPVPDIVESEVLAFAREASIALQDARVWPMTSEKLSFPAESTAPTVAWGATTGEGTPVVSEVELTALELSSYSALRNPLLQDTRSDIVSWLTEVMSEAAGKELDLCMFRGDGAAASASCSGVLSAAAGYSVVFASTSTNFSALTATHLSSAIAALDGLKKVGAKFYMHGSILHYVRNLKDSNNRPIFVDTVGGPMSGTIWGYPYREAIMCPSTSAVSTGFIVFGNLRYFAVGRKLDSMTLEANPWGDTAWAGNQTWFKLYNRWALKVALGNGFCRIVTAAS